MSNWIKVSPRAFWGPRTIPDCELVLIVEGRYAYERPGRDSLSLSPGMVLCIPPDEKHTLRYLDEDVAGWIACIHQELTARGAWASLG